MVMIRGLNVLAVVVSADRPHQVARMEAMCDWPIPLTWVVPAEQVEDYEFQGARAVLTVPTGPRPNICGSRNLVLDYFTYPDAIVMLDDDTKQFRFVHTYKGTSAHTRRESLPFVVDHLLEAMEHHPEARLGGIGPTANWLYVCGGERIKTRTFIQSNFALVKRGPLRYDTTLELSEDYDFCIQQIATYGCIVRDDLILGDYTKRTNSGGLQTMVDREQKDIASRSRLQAKWPEYVQWPNPKSGPREVLVNWKAIKHGA